MKKVSLPCLHPHFIPTRKGNLAVSCGKCIPCQNAKRARLNLLLDLESQGAKYCEFLTNTYSDDFIPWIYFSDVYFGMTFENYRDMRFPRHFGDRFINRVLRGKNLRVHDNNYSHYYCLPPFGGLS